MSGSFDDIIRQAMAQYAQPVADKLPVKPDTIDSLGLTDIGGFNEFLKRWQEEMAGARKPTPKPTDKTGT